MIPADTETPTRSSAGIMTLPLIVRCDLGCGLLIAASLFLSSAFAEAGSLAGHVRYDGLRTKPPTIYMSADPACDKIHPNGRPADIMVVDEASGLANVLVYIADGLPDDYRPPQPTGSVVVDQIACAYSPHVVGVLVGQELEVRSSDETIHNVNARPSASAPFNLAMPRAGHTIRKSFSQPEVAVKLKCDIHPWMTAYVGVFPHPFFAVSGTDGSFKITGLPDGEYTVIAWHELLGTRSAKMDIDEEDDVTFDFSFVGN